MTTNSKTSRNLASQTRPVELQPEDAAVTNVADQDLIRIRAYEIYLERGGMPGDELDDWLRAERELQDAALFAEDRSRPEHNRTLKSGNGN